MFNVCCYSIQSLLKSKSILSHKILKISIKNASNKITNKKSNIKQSTDKLTKTTTYNNPSQNHKSTITTDNNNIKIHTKANDKITQNINSKK